MPKTGGRRPGVTNKATADARAAIGQFVDGNAHRLQGWLDAIAAGVKNEEGEYVVAPNPEKAFNLFQSVVEYHVPKLARSESTTTLQGPDGGAIPVDMSISVIGVRPATRTA